MVSVVATRPDRELASFSNRCGIAAPWCIAAPGVDVPVAYFGPEDPADPFASGLASPSRGQERLPGTSFAAPLVAGGLAVLKHQFRGQLGNEALLGRLYATADKGGPAAPDEVSGPGVCPAHLDTDGDLSSCELSSTHGQGIMDLDAATRPVGEVRAAMGSRLAQRGVSFAGSGLGSSAAVGDALALGLAGQELALFDTLDAPFWMSLGSLVQPASYTSLGTRLDALLAPDAETVRCECWACRSGGTGRTGRLARYAARDHASQARLEQCQRCTGMDRRPRVTGGGRHWAHVAQHRRRSVASLVLHHGACARRTQGRAAVHRRRRRLAIRPCRPAGGRRR